MSNSPRQSTAQDLWIVYAFDLEQRGPWGPLLTWRFKRCDDNPKRLISRFRDQKTATICAKHLMKHHIQGKIVRLREAQEAPVRVEPAPLPTSKQLLDPANPAIGVPRNSEGRRVMDHRIER